jgi:hypothetical protein
MLGRGTKNNKKAEGSVRKEEEEPRLFFEQFRRLFFELRESRRLCKREKERENNNSNEALAQSMHGTTGKLSDIWLPCCCCGCCC